MGTRSRAVTFRRLLIAGTLLMSGCGASSKLEFYAHEPGNFRALAAGKPEISQQQVSSAAGQLSMSSIQSVDADLILRVVTYLDLPRSAVESNDPAILLDGGIKGMTSKGQWTIQSLGPITLDGHPGREVRFAVNPDASSEKGAGRARILLVGDRLYQAIMVGPASKVSEEELDHFVKSFELLNKVAAAAPTPPMIATANPIVASPTPAAREETPLSGDESEPPVASRQPTTSLAENGPPPATTDEATPAAEPTPSALAKPDPAPAQAASAAPTRPTPLARPAPNAPRPRPPAEEPVLTDGDPGPDPAKPAEIPIETLRKRRGLTERPQPNGNPNDRFRALAPEHGVLVGMRIGYIDAFGGSKIGSIQPIFQVRNDYIEGKSFGKEIDPSLTIIARPGYAVGAINIKSGLLVDAFQLVFMRFRDGKLVTRDSYTTDWLGDPRGGGASSATGEGKLVIGVHGRTNGREIDAIGLIIAE